MASTSAPRYTLRDLPLAAKWVVSTFLISVGVGYFAALIQIHMQHSARDGSHMPSPADVVAVFSGKKWQLPGGPVDQTVCKFEELLSGDPGGSLTSKNMTPAFFAEDGADYQRRKDEKPAQLPRLNAERHGERSALIAWANAAPDARRASYEDDKFALPPALAKQPLTEGYRTPRGEAKVRSIVRDRCARCHKPGGEKGDTPLTTYEELAEYMPKRVEVPEGGGWVDSGKQMDLVKLTQSTHAHLLSFAMLFALTGLTFAFTGYPGAVRGILAPTVLVAQVADVACWWLARLEAPYGPVFALCILGTGGVVGLGLAGQIVLSLFDMYGAKGKLVLVVLFAGGAAGGAVVNQKVIGPYLKSEQDKKANGSKVDHPAAANGAPKTGTGPGRFEALIAGKYDKGGSWGGKSAGGMVRAFFNKEDEFKGAEKKNDPDLPKMAAEREGEQAGMVAWAQAADDVRKKAYEDDKFPLPAALAGKPFTKDFAADDKALKVKSLLAARCVVCHGKDGDKEDLPLETYDQILKYIKEAPPAAKAEAAAPADPPAVAAAPTPIPMADE